MKSFIQGSLLLIFFFQGVLSQSLSGKVVSQLKESTVYLEVTHTFPLSGEEITTSGTGFLVSKDGLVVTNNHVIQPLLSVYSLTFPSIVTAIRVVRNSGSEHHKKIKATILARDRENDLALLSTCDSLATPFISVQDITDLNETTPIWVFGYPFGETFSVIQRGPEITVGKGSVSALRHDDQGNLINIQIDASINPGNSGGPVVNDKGKVIGIVKMAYGTSGVNLAVPINFLTPLLKSFTADTSRCKNSKAAIKINITPSDAAIFVDRKKANPGPTKEIAITPGWQVLNIMKEGFNSWVIEKYLADKQQYDITLIPTNSLSLITTKRKNLKSQKKIKNIYDTGAVLLKEHFDNKKTFKQWDQYTGGTEKRTWFLENSALHQFESNEILHAIYLGDTNWQDYIVKAKVKITDNHDDSRAGIIFRETADGFYLFRIYKESNKAQLAYHCKQPFGWFIIDEKKVSGDIDDSWYTMVVSCIGNTISCYLDTECLFNIQSGYSNLGRIGFYSVESKASFDSLVVLKARLKPGSTLPASVTGLLSYWFSDYFNLKSTWWYQYNEKTQVPKPWLFTDGGSAFSPPNNDIHVSEFVKYKLDNFVARLLLSLGESNENSVFELFFRKDNTGYKAIRWSKKEKKIIVLSKKNKHVKILKKETLASELFTNTRQLTFIVHNDRIICKIGDNTIIDYKNKNIKKGLGSFGFKIRKLPLVFHSLTVASVPKDLSTLVPH